MSQTDRDLIRACRSGDTRAWERLLDKYERLVFAISLNYGLTTDEAADITQITFTILLQNLDTLPDDIRLSPWLATVARRHAWRLLARKRREAFNTDEDLAGNETLGGILDNRERWELAEWLNQGLSLLDERVRQLLLALYFDAEQPSYAQIADRLKMPIGSIGPTRARGLEQMRQYLQTVELPAAARGIMEKTRGDVTFSLRGENLAEAIRMLSRQLSGDSTTDAPPPEKKKKPKEK